MPQVARNSLLQELAAIPSELFTREFGEQNAAICYRRSSTSKDIEVLLLTSRDTGRWVIPKGWPMKGKKSHRAAAIEAWEEAGVTGKIRKDPFGCFTYVKRLNDGSRRPVTVRVFLMRVKKQEKAFREVGQRKLEWVSPIEAARRVREPELKSLLSKLDTLFLNELSEKKKPNPEGTSA